MFPFLFEIPFIILDYRSIWYRVQEKPHVCKVYSRKKKSLGRGDEENAALAAMTGALEAHGTQVGPNPNLVRVLLFILV